jgi:integrative and conjugative element protein (TIGR02256 family)
VPPADGLVAPGKVWIADSAISTILAEAADRAPLETGGMLVGYRGDDRPDLVVTAATGPGPRARHRRYTFAPDGRWQQRLLAAMYEESGRVTTYLGDWHSHPGGQPLPSARDQKTARKVSRRPGARAPHPITLILGVDDDTPVIATYIIDDGSFTAVTWETFAD